MPIIPEPFSPIAATLTIPRRQLQETARTSKTIPVAEAQTTSNSHKLDMTSPDLSATAAAAASNVIASDNILQNLTNSSPSPEILTTHSLTVTKRGLSSTVLMWIFAVIGVGLLTSVMIWRYTCWKLQTRNSNRHYGVGSSPGVVGLGSQGPARGLGPTHLLDDQNQDSQSRPIILSTSFLHSGLVPVVHRDGTLVNDTRRFPHYPQYHSHQHQHHHHQRVRGADVDEGGRRGGNPDGNGGASIVLEELPAYDAGKSPPGYNAVAFTPNPAPTRDSEGGGTGSVMPQQAQNLTHVQPPPIVPWSSRPPHNDNGNTNSTFEA